MRFRALKDFRATIGGRDSSYRAGLSYTARPQDAALIEATAEWLRDGRIEKLDDQPVPRSRVSGSATLGPKPA